MKNRNSNYGLAIPEQVNNPDAPDISEQTIKALIQQLPLDNLSDTYQQLYQHLYQSNRINYDWKLRLQYLEVIREPVIQVLRSLFEQNKNLGFPLNEKQEQILNSVEQLCKEMARGYKITLKHILKLPDHVQQKDLLAKITHRTLRYISHLIFNAYQHYTQPAQGYWLEVNRLYQRAESRDFHTIDIDDPEFTTRRSGSIRLLYLQLMLFNAASPSRLPVNEIKPFYQVLENWCKHTDTKQIRSNHKELVMRVIDYDEDRPSKLIQITEDDVSNNHNRSLTLSALVEAIYSHLQGKESTEILEPLKYISRFSDSLLRQIAKSWSNKTFRGFRRIKSDENTTINLIPGLDQIHKVLAKVQGSDIEVMEENLEATYHKLSHLNQNDSLWDQKNNLNGDNTKARIKPITVITSYWQQWKVMNSSPNGYRLASKELNSGKISVGDLIAINEDPDNEHCAIGVVRWLHLHSNKRLEAGLEVLSPTATPLMMKSSAKHEMGTKSQPGLLLPQINVIKKPETLITPVKVFNSGDKLSLSTNGGIKNVIVENHESGNNFNHFRVLSNG